MQKRAIRVVIFLILMTLTMTNITYAHVTVNQQAPYGPKVEDLKGKEDLVKKIQEIKRIRENIIVVNIKGDTSVEELKSIDKTLESYILQFNSIRKDLDKHKDVYKNSFSDVFFAEEILFIADSFIISLRQQQYWVRALESGKEDAKTLFYSGYLIPIYYYLTLGDQMISYIETYFVLTK